MGRRLKWIAWMLTILLLCTAGAAAAGGADTGQTNPAIPESFDEESLLDLARKVSSAVGAHAETGEEASEPVLTLENALAVLAEKCTDPWQKAILLSGPETVSEDEEGLTFFLSPYDPGLAEIRDLSEDPAAFLQAASGNAMTHSLEIRAVLEGDSFTAKSGKAILATTKKGCCRSKESVFGQGCSERGHLRLFSEAGGERQDRRGSCRSHDHASRERSSGRIRRAFARDPVLRKREIYA